MDAKTSTPRCRIMPRVKGCLDITLGYTSEMYLAQPTLGLVHLYEWPPRITKIAPKLPGDRSGSLAMGCLPRGGLGLVRAAGRVRAPSRTSGANLCDRYTALGMALCVFSPVLIVFLCFCSNFGPRRLGIYDWDINILRRS